IDPIKLGLLFERFLSRERAEPPDIDIDFEHERREEVIQYIYRKYGSRHAAMVCTTIRYRSRMALREVSKVMGVSLENTNRLVKAMGREGLSRFIQTHAETPIDPGLFGLSERKFRLILQMADELKGFPRHLGIHTGGFVISHEPVVDIVPVESATMDQRYVIQWNKDDVAALGLMKLDILSLGMLSAIRKAFQMLQESKGLSASLSSIPQEDQDTYKMIQKADTIGTFQIESRAQMSLLPRLKPKTWYDLVVQVAIVRPGPLQGGMVHPYLRRRSGEEKITYAHERLKPILEKTMGVPIFQEQVMQIVVAVAGFTPGESDELRRVVSSAWRKRKVMHGLRQRLINGMLNNGIPSAYAEQIFKVIQGFAEYGFPESHAASFALLTYVSSWLKRHHPDIFATALLNSQPMGFYPPRILIADAKRNGVVFLPLDIQHSDWEYRLTPSNHVLKNVRVGLCSVDGLSEHDIAILINERSRQGAFRDLEDLVRRTRLHKKTLMRLATAGALHSLTKEGEDVRRTLFALQGIDFNQQSFFYGISPSNEGCSGIPIETEWESIVREFQTKGFSLTNHPIGLLRGIPGLLKGYKTAQDLPLLPNGTQVKIIGLRSLLQKPPTASGVCFASLEDETGIFNVIVMPDVYERVRLTLYNHGLLEIKGRLEIKKGVVHIRATDVSPLREGNGLPSEPHRYYG
ncbi:MAG: error-prone DNA polymerase, partial [Bdellovibrionales bacterium]|nr:error-prone DNA polymerase [Bdellovibrionales bacterium]